MRFHKNLSVSSSDESREAIRCTRGCSGLLLKIQSVGDGGLSFLGFGNVPRRRIGTLYFISLNRTHSVVRLCLLGFLVILI